MEIVKKEMNLYLLLLPLRFIFLFFKLFLFPVVFRIMVFGIHYGYKRRRKKEGKDSRSRTCLFRNCTKKVIRKTREGELRMKKKIKRPWVRAVSKHLILLTIWFRESFCRKKKRQKHKYKQTNRQQKQ